MSHNFHCYHLVSCDLSLTINVFVARLVDPPEWTNLDGKMKLVPNDINATWKAMEEVREVLYKVIYCSTGSHFLLVVKTLSLCLYNSLCTAKRQNTLGFPTSIVSTCDKFYPLLIYGQLVCRLSATLIYLRRNLFDLHVRQVSE